MARWLVRVERGGPWDWSKDMREQDGWDGHAAYMDGIFEEGWLLLVGPIADDRHTMWLVEADSEQEIRDRMREDPWAKNGMLRPVKIERWNIVLDRLPAPKPKTR